MKRLLDEDTRWILEHQVEVKINGWKTYGFILHPGESYVWTDVPKQPRNFRPDPDSPLKFTYNLV